MSGFSWSPRFGRFVAESPAGYVGLSGSIVVPQPELTAERVRAHLKKDKIAGIRIVESEAIPPGRLVIVQDIDGVRRVLGTLRGEP